MNNTVEIIMRHDKFYISMGDQVIRDVKYDDLVVLMKELAEMVWLYSEPQNEGGK